MKHFVLLVLLVACAATAATEGPEPSIPLVPLTSRFGYWDHHWFVWLPRHPVYEAVEILSRDTPGDPRKLVIVFFTERAGGKRQDFYLDNVDAVAQWPGGLYRPMRYARSGTDGGPQGVLVTFTDKDGHSVEIEV